MRALCRIPGSLLSDFLLPSHPIHDCSALDSGTKWPDTPCDLCLNLACTHIVCTEIWQVYLEACHWRWQAALHKFSTKCPAGCSASRYCESCLGEAALLSSEPASSLLTAPAVSRLDLASSRCLGQCQQWVRSIQLYIHIHIYMIHIDPYIYISLSPCLYLPLH